MYLRRGYKACKVLDRNYTLIIAEKPKAASKIAKALSKGKAVKRTLYNVPYWVFERNGKKYIVAPAVGHLFGITTDTYGFPVYDYKWVPIWEAETKANYARKYFLCLKKLCEGAVEYINACDYDIEGSVIGYMIIKNFGDVNRAKRMKFSSLTDDELEYAFNNLIPSLDWPLIEAGLCRHELDWLWGINSSRALMEAIRRVSKRKIILSAGRVQSPTLIEVVKREIERNTYIPTVHFKLELQVSYRNSIITLVLEGKNLRSQSEAEEVKRLIEKKRYAIVRVVREEYKEIPPPPPFNLGDLQAEAYRIYGLTPIDAQRIAEDLYLDALISYPRTNSQKLPKTLNYTKILHSLSRNPKYSDLVNLLLLETEGKLKPREGFKDDPAHPAIYPTGILPSKFTSKNHEKIYDLIVKRFIACFAPKTIIKHGKIVVEVAGYTFTKTYKAIKDYGWLKYYPFYEIEETYIPPLREGDKLPILKVKVVTVYTKPPKALTKTDILKWMEQVNIGTEGTRARIIETLFSRKYLEVKAGKVEVTKIGYCIAEILSTFFKELTSVELTRKFEEYINNIRFNRVKREGVLNEAKKTINKLIENYRKSLYDIGIILSKSLNIIPISRKCIICDNEAVANKPALCKYHLLAYEKLIKHYQAWRSIFRSLDWNNYLKKIINLKGSCGRWVREVAQAIYERRVDVDLSSIMLNSR